MGLFDLPHLLCQLALRMQQMLWPEDFVRMTCEVEEALREADDPNAKSFTHEEVMQSMRERIDPARDTL
jgi:hypothetical protein